MPPLLATLRPKQWIKNLFVFAPLVFSQRLFAAEAVLPAVRLFAAFCALSSAVYILNDLADRAADARHPRKRLRPIASGAVGVRAALGVLSACVVATILLATTLNTATIAALGAYAAINLAYSAGLKHIVLVDVFCIAAGFMIRVLAGAATIEVQASPWLILCALFLSLLLALAKRRSELRLRDGTETPATRTVLDAYSVAMADQMTTITAAGVVIAYALYTVSDRTVRMFGTENLIYTTIFVLYGVFRYLYLERTERVGESPTDVVTTDVPLIVNMALWIAAIVLIIYLRPR